MKRPGLFERTLGASWAELPEIVKRGHELEGGLHGDGAFDVVHGASFLARLFARAMGMPRPGRAIPTTLDVKLEGDDLVWRRDFGGTRLESSMYAIDGGRIAERRGPIELCLRVSVRDGGVEYRCEGARLRVGNLRVPLPSFLAPRIEGRVWADGDAMRTRIAITSFVGMIATYEGPLRFGA
ncbi:MAG TPA: DUF4166 domain-containing protein [Polyangiaceae bacterium]